MKSMESRRNRRVFHRHTSCMLVHMQPRRVFKDRDGRVRHYKGLDEEVPEERPEGVCIHVWVCGRAVLWRREAG